MAGSGMEVEAQEECPKDNFKSRPYQDQLLEIALKENVIIYLPTGAGKTYIALMAIRHMSHKLEGSLKDGGKRTVFLCNTVALAKQQSDAIRKHTNLKVSVYTGDMNVDNWKNDKWINEFDNNQVIVATTQIVVDVIRHGYMSIPDFNLIIFDECHHAKGEHPMFQLLSLFTKYPEHLWPRVIGLTGLLINPSSKHKIVDELNTLEAIFRGRIITVGNFDEYTNVLVYSTKPKEIVLTYQENYQPMRVQQVIDFYVTKCLELVAKWKVDQTHVKYSKNLCTVRAPNPIKKIENLLKDFQYQMKDMGLYAASIAILGVLVEVELKKRASETITYKNLLRTCITYIDRIRHVIVKSLYSFQNDDDDDDDFKETEEMIILSNSTPKLQSFLNYLKTTFVGKDRNDIKALVFVHRRHTAKCLYHVIKRWVTYHPQIPIIPEFMVGHNEGMPESVEYVLDAKWNKNVLQSFKKNESNLIVCSSVLEEGIDIQSCNHVIMFDKILTFRSYVQSKGRARKQDSTYAMMISDIDKSKQLQKLVEYREIDSTLKDYLIGKTIDRSPPLQEDIDRQFQHQIKPFYTKIGACLEAASSIQLVNRYCLSLPNDSFTTSTIEWKKLEKNEMTYVRLLLPLQSSIKDEIWSDPMNHVRISKQSAAFKACKMLYEAGELNDNLLPISKVKRTEIISPFYFKHWEDFVADNPSKAGTKQNKRLYDIEYPHQLRSCLPTTDNQELYLYTINLIPIFEEDSENKHLINLFSLPNSYGILTSKKLPKIAEMPLFMNYGQVNAIISDTPIIINNIKLNDLKTLRNYHIMIFRDLLQIWKNFLAYNLNNDDNSYLIVPIRNGKDINWDLIRNFQNLSKIREPTEMQRLKQQFNENDYLGNIVCPWYSIDQDIRYVIVKIRNDLTPLSSFPNNEYNTFADYIFDKYQKRVIKTNQFLLEAKAITTRMNFLHYHNDGVTPKKRKLDDIILIPELCHNFKYPGEMYLKAKFLPTILHRLHYILLAENLRYNINSYLKLNFYNYKPQKLIIDTTLKRISEEKSKNSKRIKLPLLQQSKDAKLLTDLISITENCQYHWKSYEEPCDFSRFIDSIYKIELDYYHQFITDSLNRMSITNNNELLPACNEAAAAALASSSSSSNNSTIKSKQAICDTPIPEKLYIKILDIIEPQNSAEQWEFLSAITSSSASDVFDMERIELLGDSFLKFSISFYLLHKYPQWNEGHLTAVKGKFVSNRNLLYCAIKNHNICGLINTQLFNPRNDWLPPLVNVPKNILQIIKRDNISPSVLWKLELDDEEIENGECKESTQMNFVSNFTEESQGIECDLNLLINKQVINDKTVADCMEAILGVCIKNYGIKKSFSVLEYLGILPKNENLSNLLNINLGSPRLKAGVPNRDIDAFLINYQQLEEALGYKFNDRAYLLQALTHPSYPTNRLTGCYQQLEFIGDAILDFLISCYIFERCKNMDPGKLTDLRSALVNNVTLACIAVRNKFHLFMLIQNAALAQSIDKFVTFQETQNNKVTDQVRILIQEDEKPISCTMADYVDVPKALGDVFEAIIGAIFLDCKNNLKQTWQIIYKLMENEINEFMANTPIQVVRQLYEYHGANPQFAPPIEHDDITMVSCKFTCRDKICEVNGFGKNKDQAKIAAAKLALQTLTQA